MRVYQFIDPEAGISVLQTKRLRISRLDRLNDPFEFLGANLSRREHRHALRAMKAELGKDRGVLCFSQSWHNPVLWGHYARKHQGICLGFDMPTKHLRQVNYVTSRFSWPDELSLSFIEQVMFSKFVHWSYEDEYRAWISLDHNEAEDGHYYFPFCQDMQLKQVLVGAESTLTRANISMALGAAAEDVEVFKVRAAFRSFRVVRNRNERLWT
jgi:hypothetical protein